jgi:hypothetical protein
MGTAASRGGRKPASIRTLWAIAKSQELELSDDDLHALVYGQTGKESMKKLTQGEINQIARVLQNMKDGTPVTQSKRTDEGGDPRTESQRRKIYALCEELGWNDDVRRINGFAKKMCGVERIEWLTMAQCHKIIEALKKMVDRQKGANSHE